MEFHNIFGVKDEGKTAGLCSYFFVLGWSVSYFGYHKIEKTSYSSFHLRQTLFLYISYVAARFGLLAILGKAGLLSGMLSFNNLVIFTNVAFLLLWIIGLTGATSGKEKHIPVFGRIAQHVFSGI